MITVDNGLINLEVIEVPRRPKRYKKKEKTRT